MKRSVPELAIRIGLVACAWLLTCGLAHADEAALLAELRQGGVAILMRHAQTTPGVGDPPGWRLADCPSQRNLDEAGVAHAKRIGKWFAEKKLRPTKVRRFAATLRRGERVVLVSHGSTIRHIVDVSLAPGEGVVVRGDASRPAGAVAPLTVLGRLEVK